jgi:hypothetical protein
VNPNPNPDAWKQLNDQVPEPGAGYWDKIDAQLTKIERDDLFVEPDDDLGRQTDMNIFHAPQSALSDASRLPIGRVLVGAAAAVLIAVAAISVIRTATADNSLSVQTADDGSSGSTASTPEDGDGAATGDNANDGESGNNDTAVTPVDADRRRFAGTTANDSYAVGFIDTAETGDLQLGFRYDGLPDTERFQMGTGSVITGTDRIEVTTTGVNQDPRTFNGEWTVFDEGLSQADDVFITSAACADVSDEIAEIEAAITNAPDKLTPTELDTSIPQAVEISVDVPAERTQVLADPNPDAPWSFYVSAGATGYETTGNRVMTGGEEWMELTNGERTGWLQASFVSPASPSPDAILDGDADGTVVVVFDSLTVADGIVTFAIGDRSIATVADTPMFNDFEDFELLPWADAVIASDATMAVELTMVGGQIVSVFL